MKPYELEPIRSSILLLSIKLVFMLFIIDSFYSFLTLFLFDLPVLKDFHFQLVTSLFFTHFIKNAFSIYLVLNVVLKWVSNVFFITDKYITKREGIINIKEQMFDLKNVHTVLVQQGFIGKLLNYGDVDIKTQLLSGQSENIHMSSVSDPQKYKNIFKHCLEITNYVVS